jgi:hypothetical protein
MTQRVEPKAVRSVGIVGAGMIGRDLVSFPGVGCVEVT